MKTILFVLFSLQSLYAQESELMRSTIEDPAQSRRCKELFKEREEKISMKQKLSALLQRNEVLQKRSPDNKLGIKKRLEVSQLKIKQEIDFNTQQIQTAEERIIRSGCPGLNL